MKALLLTLVVLFGGVSLSGGESALFQAGELYVYKIVDNVNSIGVELSSGNELAYTLTITMTGPNTVSIKPDNFKVFDKGGIYDLVISETLWTYLKSPIEVTLEDGGVKSIKIEADMPEWVVNFKKKQVLYLILNGGVGPQSPASNFQNNAARPQTQSFEYETQEFSFFGYCPTKYSVKESNPIFSQGGIYANYGKGKGFSDSESSEESGSIEAPEASNSVQDSVEEEGEQFPSTFNNGYQQEDHFGEFNSFCENGAKMYEFKKSVDLGKCNTTTEAFQSGMATARYVACGLDQSRLTILAVVYNGAGSPPQTDKWTLSDILPLPADYQLSTFRSPIETSDFYFKTKDKKKLKLKLYTSEDENESGNENAYKEPMIAFRLCLTKNGLPPKRLVTRDLNSHWYNHLNHQWNLRKEKIFPLAYFLPTTAADVAEGVKCGLKTNVHVVPNSGGHSYEAVGWGTNETLVIDFRNMRAMSVVGAGAEAVGQIQPGAMVGPINAFFWANGGYAMPMGNCLTVGLGGHAIGGGIGFFSPMYGLTLDNVLEVEMVDGRGKIVVANKDANSDLFWALRGSGPGYLGIVTSVKVKLFQASKIKITFVRLRYQIKHYAKVWIAFQKFLDWIKTNEPTIFLSSTLVSDTYNASLPQTEPGMTVTGVHIQDPLLQPKGNEAFLKAMRNTFPQPAEIIESYPNYIQFVALTGYAPVILPQKTSGQLYAVARLNDPIIHNSPHVPTFNDLPSEEEILIYMNMMKKDISAPRYFKAKSLFVKKYFSLREMKKVAAVVARIPQNNVWLMVNTEQGAIHRVASNATAYVHRDSVLDFSIHYEGSGKAEDVGVGMKFLHELWGTIQFMDGGETYQNYPDFDVQNHFERNYKGNFGRLLEAKIKWDPKNYFKTPLSIPIYNTSTNSF